MRAFFVLLTLVFAAPAARAAEEASTDWLPAAWSHEGVFGTFDRGALRRGLQVYREVCAACHGMKYIAFRNLGEAGGLELPEAVVEEIARSYQIEDGPDSEGDMFEREGRPADTFPSPFANDAAARSANGGALPPDLSLIVRARAGGVDYIHSLLLGYRDTPPEGVVLLTGQHYNIYFPGHVLAMVPPLQDELVDYEDGTQASVAQMAKDVSVFLAWASDPSTEERKRLGFQVMLYIIALAVLLFFTSRKLWSGRH